MEELAGSAAARWVWSSHVDLHPWSQKPELVRYLNDSTITPIAYSSLVPLFTWRTAEGQDSAKTDQMKADGEQADAPFEAMAKKYGEGEAHRGDGVAWAMGDPTRAP